LEGSIKVAKTSVALGVEERIRSALKIGFLAVDYFEKS